MFVNQSTYTQNTRIWATEHPHEIHEVPLHSEKTGVWCAISRRRIIGPIFFHETLNTARYLEIVNEFVDQLDDDELRNGYFQQDGATCHTSNESMAEINSFFFLMTGLFRKPYGRQDLLT